MFYNEQQSENDTYFRAQPEKCGSKIKSILFLPQECKKLKRPQDEVDRPAVCWYDGAYPL
jgi:hypothetical protein